MDKRYLKNNHDKDVVEKRRNENYIKYKYYKCTYLWIEIWSMAIKLSDPRTFSACCDGGRGCHSAVLRGDHHCDVVAVDVVGTRRGSLSGSLRGSAWLA